MKNICSSMISILKKSRNIYGTISISSPLSCWRVFGFNDWNGWIGSITIDDDGGGVGVSSSERYSNSTAEVFDPLIRFIVFSTGFCQTIRALLSSDVGALVLSSNLNSFFKLWLCFSSGMREFVNCAQC